MRGCACRAKEIGADMLFSRLVIGVLVILAALWVIVSEQMAGASADAVVNAQVVVVRTPIAGTLRDADRSLGSAVSAGDALATVVDPMPDAVRLDDLVLQRELAEIRRSERRTARWFAVRRNTGFSTPAVQYCSAGIMGSKFIAALTAIFIVGLTICLSSSLARRNFDNTCASIWESADVLPGPQCRNDIFVSESSPTNFQTAFSTEVGAAEQILSTFSLKSSPTLFFLSREP